MCSAISLYLLFFVLWQSVLVTIDRHEWYAPPQWYRREDASGIWQITTALPNSILYSSDTAAHLKETGAISHPKHSTEDKACVDAPNINEREVEVGPVSSHDDGVSTIECEQIAADNPGGNDSKRRRVLEESSDGTFVTSDCKIEPVNDDNLALDHGDGLDNVGVGMRMTTSVESVMESALVMFEVLPAFLASDGYVRE